MSGRSTGREIGDRKRRQEDLYFGSFAATWNASLNVDTTVLASTYKLRNSCAATEGNLTPNPTH